MQKKYGFKPLGPADGQVKRAILGDNNARLTISRPNSVRRSKTIVLHRSRKIIRRRAKAAAIVPTVISLSLQHSFFCGTIRIPSLNGVILLVHDIRMIWVNPLSASPSQFGENRTQDVRVMRSIEL